jgi:hypothetical protein
MKMRKDIKQLVDGVIASLAPDYADWVFVEADEMVVERPAQELSVAELIDAGLLDGLRHYRAGDDLYITVGKIHLRRPK